MNSVIDAGSDYLIAYDGEKIYGAGNNEYHQFEREDYQKDTLAQVSNVKISIGDTIDVSFDSVENASGYEVKMNAGELMIILIIISVVIALIISIISNKLDEKKKYKNIVQPGAPLPYHSKYILTKNEYYFYRNLKTG